MKQSELVAALAAFVFEVANQEVSPTQDAINLALANWVIDNDITIFSSKEKE